MGLTPGALVFAIFCVLWTGTTAFVAGAVGWLYIRTRRQIEFISLISIIVVVAMCSSMAQQIYTIARWDHVQETQRQDSILVAGKTTFFDVGSDKVVKAFYYIQILCYNIAGTLIAFWCFFLWANVWPLQCFWWSSTTYSLVTKVFTVVTACSLTGISQIPYFSDKHLARFLVGNILLILVLAITPIFLVLILHRYIYYRWVASRALQGGNRQSWRRRQMNSFPKEVWHSTSNVSSSGTPTDAALELETFPKEREAKLTLDTSMSITRTRKTFGTMLMVRFLGAIIVMSGLEIFHICFQLSRVLSYRKTEYSVKEIPLTTTAQIGDTYMFLPSTSQGWLVLLVFGTTEDYWRQFKALLAGIFGCGYASRVLRRNRQNHHHQCNEAAATGNSTDNFIANHELQARAQLQSTAEEGGIEGPEAVYMVDMNTARTSRRQSLPLSHGTKTQFPNSNHKRSTSLMASLSKPLPPPPRAVHSPSGVNSASPSTPEPWDLRTPGTYTWRIERES